MKAEVTVPEVLVSKIRAESSEVLIVLSIEGREDYAVARDVNGKIEIDLRCYCSQKRETIENTLASAGMKKALLSFQQLDKTSEGCLSCSIAAALAGFYSSGKFLDLMRGLEVDQEFRAAAASSLLGGISIYSIRGRTPALLRYFYPSEAIKLIFLENVNPGGEFSAPKSALYDFVEGLSLIYSGENEEGLRALVSSSNSILKREGWLKGSEDIPLFPSMGGLFMLIPSSASCSSYVMEVSSKASDFIKSRSGVKVTRLSRGATVLIND